MPKFRRGAPRTCGDTCCLGVLSVLGLMVVLLGPLLLFSAASPLAGDNTLTGAELHLQLVMVMRETDGGQAQRVHGIHVHAWHVHGTCMVCARACTVVCECARPADGEQAASATFDLGDISSYRLAPLQLSAPLLSTRWHYWRCLVVGHQSDAAAQQCGYHYLVGSRSATYQVCTA